MENFDLVLVLQILLYIEAINSFLDLKSKFQIRLRIFFSGVLHLC